MAPPVSRRQTILAGTLVGAAALGVFAPALSNGFVDWDDNVLVLGNPHFR